MQSLQLDNRPLQSRKRTHFLSSDLLWKRVRQNYQRPFITNIFRNGICQAVPGWSGWMQHIQGWHSRTVGILQSLKICGILMLLPCLQLTKFTIDQRKCGFPQLRCLDSAGIYHQPQASSGVYPSAPSVLCAPTFAHQQTMSLVHCHQPQPHLYSWV